MTNEPLKVRICPGCGKLHAEANLPHRVHLYEPALRNYFDALVCDPCHAVLRDSVAAAVGKAQSRNRSKKSAPISE